MELIATTLVHDACDSCEQQGICVSVLTTVREWTLCTGCLYANTELMELTHGF